MCRFSDLFSTKKRALTGSKWFARLFNMYDMSIAHLAKLVKNHLSMYEHWDQANSKTQNAKNLHFWYMRASLCRPTHYDKLDQWKINTDKHWQVEGRTTSNKTESCARSGLCNRNWYHRYKRRVCKIQKWAICVGKRMVVCLGQSLSLLHCKGGIRENKLNFMTFAIKVGRGVGVASG